MMKRTYSLGGPQADTTIILTMNGGDPPPAPAPAGVSAAPAPGLVPAAAGLSEEVAAQVLSHPARWALLRRLSRGEALPVKYLADHALMPSTTCTRQLAVLKKAGLVESVYGRLYRMPAAWTQRIRDGWLDMGPVGLRVPSRAAASVPAAQPGT